MRAGILFIAMAIAIALAEPPRLIIADEPVATRESSETTAEDRSPVAGVSSDKDDDARREKLKSSLKRISSEQTYDLRYKFKVGESIRWTMEHLVTHETSVKDTKQSAKSRSLSTKVWKIVESNDDRIVLEYSIDDVDMWQHVSGRPEVRFNSRSDEIAPREYESVARQVQVPLALVTMDTRGKIIDKTYPTAGASPTVAELAIPLPPKPIKVGANWHWPEEITLRLESKRIQRVQLRHVYTLLAVDKNIATLGIRTEVLTPIDDPKIHGRLLDRLKKGSAKFDMESGRFTSMQLDLDETVVGFAGAESLLEYRARFIEEIAYGPPAPTRRVTVANPPKSVGK